MIDISHGVQFDIAALTASAKLIHPQILGVSCGPKGSVIHLADGTVGAVQGQMEGLLTSFGSLVVNVNPNTIPADDSTTSSITMNTIDAEVDWLLVDVETGVVLGNGTEAAVAGVVSLSFKTGAVGIYDIWLLRKAGDFATGKVRVTVTEV